MDDSSVLSLNLNLVLSRSSVKNLFVLVVAESDHHNLGFHLLSNKNKSRMNVNVMPNLKDWE